MPATQELQDERLLELLDEALCELRSGRPLDTMAWQQRHPEQGREGASLLATLVRFAASVEDWRAALPLPRMSTRTPDQTAVEDRQVPDQIGRYVVVSRVGTGAMGTVYRAHDPQLDRLVAVKVPRMDKVPRDKGKFTERFLREARHAASVRNPHVCPIYDAGEHDGQPYVVMAYVDGEPLDHRLGRLGRFEDARVAVRVGIQVAQALAAIHQHGIIHRDLKPANILMDHAGQALLTDFGLAREIGEGEKLTMDGIVVGTPSYMSPEQASGDNSNLGPACDLYSLGTVLYEMLTGQLPFKGSVLEVLRRILVEQPPSPLEYRPDLDPQLAALVMKAVAKNPADRFSTAASFAEVLERWLDSASVSTEVDLAPAARPPNEALEARAPAILAATPAAPLLSPWYLRRKATHWLAAAAVCLVAIPAVWMAAFGKGTKEHNAANSLPDSQQGPVVARPVVLKSAPLSGHLKIKFIGHPRPDSDRAAVRHPEEGAPLFNGQLVQLQVVLNRPGYAYVIWIDSDGTALPIYPWDFGHSEALWDAPCVRGSEVPADFIRCPQDAAKGFRASGKPGMQHVVLLARTTPLDSLDKLRPMFSGLPASPLVEGSPGARYFDWSPGQGTRSGLVRGLLPGAEGFTGETEEEQTTAESGESELPLLSQLIEPSRTCEFELIKVWRFPQKIE